MLRRTRAPLRPSGGRGRGPARRKPQAHGLDPWGWEGEVGVAAVRNEGLPPPHPDPLPPKGRRGRIGGCVQPAMPRNLSRTQGWGLVGLVVASAAALVCSVPLAWMAVAELRPGVPADIATLTPADPFGLRNFQKARQSGNFLLWYLNTIIVCGGILAVRA